MPVHGEYRHLLQHARLAEDAGIPAERIFLVEDGLGLELSKSGARVLGQYPAGRVFVDGKGIGDVGSVVLRDRQILAEAGHGGGGAHHRPRDGRRSSRDPRSPPAGSST